VGFDKRLFYVSIDVRDYTPALIIGAIAERMKFSAILFFVTLWNVHCLFRWPHVGGVDAL